MDSYASYDDPDDSSSSIFLRDELPRADQLEPARGGGGRIRMA